MDSEKDALLLSLGKLLKKENLFVIILIGVLLFVIAMPTKDTKRQASKESASAPVVQQNSSAKEWEVYRKALQKEIEVFLQQMDHVGKVKVLLILDTGAEQVYEKDHITTEKMPKIQGVMVLCQGADYDRNKSTIATMLADTLGLEAHQVQVAKMGNQ